MVEPIAIDAWDEDAVRAARGDVRIPARELPLAPPSALLGRIVPTTAGSETPEDACDTARIGASIVGHRRVMLVIEVEGERDREAEEEAWRILTNEGFECGGDQKP